MIRVGIHPLKQIITDLSHVGEKSIIHRHIRHLHASDRYLFTSTQSRPITSRIKQSEKSETSISKCVGHPLSSVISKKYFATTSDLAVNGDKTTTENEPPVSETTRTEPYVITERMEHLHIMTISMNRSKKRNCVNQKMAQELLDAFNTFEADEEMYCAVFNGIGGNFSAGYDLEELADIEESDLANTVASQMIDRGPMGPTRMEFTKPVIAVIEGWCVAGGLELALMADLRVADTDAKLGFLNRRFGVPLLDGGSVRLPELIGLSRAMDLILTGRIVEAEEAHTLGLVNIVTKTGAAYGRAMHLAKEITTHPQTCLRADRASAIHATFASKSLQGSLDNEGMEGLHVLSKESIKGAKKFVSGLGKHGKFNVTPVGEKQEWQKEFEQMVKDEPKQQA